MFRINDILHATRGTLIQGSDSVLTAVGGVSIDSRTIQPQEIFIAIKGDRFDGHQFISQAIEKYAALIIVSQKKFPPLKTAFPRISVPVIHVPDTTQALGQIAHFHRHRFSIPIIAVTGSTGKTTTKEMIASVLGSCYTVLKNIATENNHIGVPMTLLKLNSSHQMAVLEFGTNRFGDIRGLSQITNPTVGLFTNIGESHLEFLKTPSGVLREKIEMIKYLHPPFTVVCNTDDPYLRNILNRKFDGKILTYGIDRPADFHATNIELANNVQLNFKMRKRQNFKLNTPAFHNVYNALAAIACGRLLKINYPQIQERIEQFNFPKGRQLVNRGKRFWVIDDTYNANPMSVRSALKTLSSLNSPGRKIFVCGDMLELGDRSEELHSSIGKTVGRTPLDAVFTIGKFSQLISQAAKKENKDLISFHGATIEGIHHRLQEYCQPGDVILVKGSRGMKMERTVEFLSQELAVISNKAKK